MVQATNVNVPSAEFMASPKEQDNKHLLKSKKDVINIYSFVSHHTFSLQDNFPACLKVILCFLEGSCEFQLEPFTSL